MKIHPPWRLPRRKIPSGYRVEITPRGGAYKYDATLYFDQANGATGKVANTYCNTHRTARRWARGVIRRRHKLAKLKQKPPVEYRL